MELTGFGSITNDEFKNFELKLGLQLPEDYKKFMIHNNGGKFKNYTGIYIPSLKDKVLFGVFFPIQPVRGLDILVLQTEFKDEIPPQSLLFANDAGGNLFLLTTDTENYGIYYWDHSYSFIKSSDLENTYRIANSFTDLMNKFVFEEK